MEKAKFGNTIPLRPQGLFSREMCRNLILVLILTVDSFLFYNLMKIEVYTAVLSVLTALWLSLFYFSFRNRWIPFGIHVVFSVLMFADVTFNAYFNGYLSVDMLGSAKYVGDVTDIILQVIRPQFYLLFLWIPLAVFPLRGRRPRASAPLERGGAADLPKNGGRRKRRSIPPLLLLVILTALFVGPISLPFFQSVGSLEFFSCHIRDILKAGFGYGEETYLAEAEASYSPDPEDPLFAVGQGRNLIVIQVEALQNFVIGAKYRGEEITPVLNQLIADDSMYFKEYYMQIGAGNTSDAEFATNNSLYGSSKSYTYELYKDNGYRGLPWLLMEKGYSTIAMHGYDGAFWSRSAMYPAQGFQSFVDAAGFRQRGTPTDWGINDEDFFIQAVSYLKGQPQPFYSFLITLSSHTPFQLPEKLKGYSNITLAEEDEGTLFGNYINSISYGDYALGVFLDQLKEAGLYHNAVIAIYGDHFGLSVSDDRNQEVVSAFLGKSYGFDTMANIPLILHIPGADAEAGLPRTVEKAGGQLDFLPTIAYVLGFDALDTLYLGNNLLAEGRGFVIQDRYAPPGSFLTDTIACIGLGDGVFETGKVWNIRTQEDVKKDRNMKQLWRKSIGLVNLSAAILEEDRLRSLYYGDGRPDRTDMKMVKLPPPEPRTKEKEVEKPEPKGTGETAVPEGTQDTGAPEDITGAAVEDGPDDGQVQEPDSQEEEELLSSPEEPLTENTMEKIETEVEN